MFIKVENSIITEILDGEILDKKDYIEVPSNFYGITGESIDWFTSDFQRKPIEQLLQEGLISFNIHQKFNPNTKRLETINDIEKILLGINPIPNTYFIEEQQNGNIGLKQKSVQQQYEEKIISFSEYIMYKNLEFQEIRNNLLNIAYSYLFFNKVSFFKKLILKKYIKKLINCIMDVNNLPTFSFPKKPSFIEESLENYV